MEVIAPLIEAHIFRQRANGLEFLLLKRAENEIYPGVWQMVTGSVDRGETGYKAALREIYEETGVHPIRFWVVPNVNSFYWPEEDAVCMVPVFAGLVDAGANVMISEEHTSYRWVSKDEALLLLAWPGQRKSVEIIDSYFNNEKKYLKFVEINLGI
jgi:dihydroneopterin triphosphate diphosphatase